MIVETLRIANLRAIEDAEFSFRPGFNLVVGINGVGKTSILDALGSCLSAILKRTNGLRLRNKVLSIDDIRVGAGALEVQCNVRIRGVEYSYLIHKPRELSVPQKDGTGMPRQQVHETPEISEFIGPSPPLLPSDAPDGRAFALLFSTNRAVPSERTLRKGAARGDVAAAFADAFAHRELRLGEYAAWAKVQESMRSERPAAGRSLDACERSVARFLPGYRNLRVDSKSDHLLVIDRETTTIPVRQLSDGERGTLALVLDLTRRLVQANPELTDPTIEAPAVVLIDEIELHLHPKWQRQIIHNLTTAFPRCQFIATTHSPQIIGEVPHDHIQIISDGMVYSPLYSFGVDSSRVLEEIMDANPRTQEIDRLLSDAYSAMDSKRVDRVRFLLEELDRKLGARDPEVSRLRTFLAFVED